MTTTNSPQQQFLHHVGGTVYFDWMQAGFKPQGWPAALKDPQIEGVTDVRTLCAYFDDSSVNPAVGGVVGKRTVASYLGMSERQLQRELACGSLWCIQGNGTLWASNVTALDAFTQMNDEASKAAWTGNLSVSN